MFRESNNMSRGVAAVQKARVSADCRFWLLPSIGLGLILTLLGFLDLNAVGYSYVLSYVQASGILLLTSTTLLPLSNELGQESDE